MKRLRVVALLALDVVVLWLFLRLLRYWSWRTGRPAYTAPAHPMAAVGMGRAN